MPFKEGADLVATIDDDNIPFANWGKDLLIQKDCTIKKYYTNEIAFDPLSVTNHSHLWHRGFPDSNIKK